MKTKILVLGLFCLFLLPLSFGQDAEEVAFDELEEIMLHQFPSGYLIEALTSPEEAAASVKALSTGMSKNKPALNGGIVCFDYYDYYPCTSPPRYLCLLVVNSSNKAVNVKIRMEMFYDEGKWVHTEAWWKTVGSNRIVLYYTKIHNLKKVGLYSIRGKLYGARGLGNTNEVVSHFYIHAQ